MYYSRSLNSSPHSIPSPDGKFIATLSQSSLVVRAVESLRITRNLKLPPELSTGITSFVWSSSSKRLLVAVVDQVQLFTVIDGGDFQANVKLPTPPANKPSFIDFGATDNELCIWSPFGIKLTIVNLSTSKAVEISNPKFFHGSSASRGCAFRPGSRHLALLTRTAGKDIIAIHLPDTREAQRSWFPDTIDAQGISWSPDGKWLVVWESLAQGSRVIFYTSDGHIFRDWHGPVSSAGSRNMDTQYGLGVRLLAFSPDGQHVAIANGSSCICMINGPSMTAELHFRHIQPIQPKDTLHVWQEQHNAPGGSLASRFVRAAQAVISPGPSTNAQETKLGGNLAKFDCSSTLLATRMEDAPTTIWIWDIPTSELRAVLIYHSSVTKVEWHPSQPELLLMRCEGEQYAGLVFVWDPLSDGPRLIDFAHRLPENKTSGRTYATWLKNTTESAAIFFTDTRRLLLGSLASPPDGLPRWEDLPANDRQDRTPARGDEESEENLSDMDEDSQLDDTFQFKKDFSAR